MQKKSKIKKIKFTKEQQQKMFDFFVKTSIPRMCQLYKEKK